MPSNSRQVTSNRFKSLPILALYLALERRNPLTCSEMMKKFIPTLPSSFCLPLNYSPKALASLPCEVYLLSVALQKNVTELFFVLGKQIGLTKEDITWAFSMVLSRTFSLPKYDKSSDLGKLFCHENYPKNS